IVCLSSGFMFAQKDTMSIVKEKDEREMIAPVAPIEFDPNAKWYNRFNIRGYAQVRYDRLFETNPNLGCEQCDKSWGNNGGFFLRRIRIIFFGQIHPRVYFYIQPDF